MAHPKIAGMLRVKNEARWIEEVLRALRPVCARVMVLDDHSDDGTPEICEAAGATVLRSTMDGIDEVRDKNFLLRNVMSTFGPDWVLCVDGDEVLEPGAMLKLLSAVESGQSRAFSLQVMYLWDRSDQVRVDGIYGRFYRPSFFNAQRSQCRFASIYGTGQAAQFHCTNVPADLVHDSIQIPVRLKHYGYMERDQRIRKWRWYNSIDPDNRNEDRYRHIVQGDLPEVPATDQLLHAGPLKLAAW